MGQALADEWRDFADVSARARLAFPDAPGHVAIARRWVMRDPAGNGHCPACGQPCPDALSLPKAHEVNRVIGATSAWEAEALTTLGPQPGFGNPEVLDEWVRRNAEISRAPLPDLRFDAGDWTLAPGTLLLFLRSRSARWLCGGCAETIAETLDPSSPALTPDRVFADLRRALDGSRLLGRLEDWRARSTTPAIARRPCRFCRIEEESFVLPWFRICRPCASRAAAAAPAPAA